MQISSPAALDMKRFAVMVAAAVIAMVVAAGPALAALDVEKLVDATSAQEKFMRLAKGSNETGEPPRLSDPDARPVIKAIFDASDLAASDELDFESYSAIGRRMQIGMTAGVVYMLAGTGVSSLKAVASDPDVARKVGDNVSKFAPEMGMFYDFQLVMEGAVVQSVASFMAKQTPEKLKEAKVASAIGNVRNGAARTVAGVIETLTEDKLDAQWRRDRLPKLLAVAPRLNSFLLDDQSAKLAAFARKSAGKIDDAELKAGLNDFADKIAKAD